MNKNKLYLADPFAEKPTYILFKEMIFNPIDCEIMIKIDNEYIRSGLTVMVWKYSGETREIEPFNPPLIFSPDNELYDNNSREIKNLYDEAVMQGAYRELEEDIIEILVYDYRKAYNISNSQLRPFNRWVVFNNNLPDFQQSALNKFYEGMK